MAETAEVVEAPPVIEKGSLAIIDKAVEKGLNAESIERLANLHLKLEAARAERAYNVAMNHTQRRMKAVLKDAKGAHGKYALLETIHKTIKPIYTEDGFSISWDTADCPLPEHIRLVADVMHAEGHTKRKQFDIPLDGEGAQGKKTAMNRTQATGSTYSYGRRYGEVLIFDLTIANEDDDGQGRSVQITEVEAELVGALCRQKGRDVAKFLAWLDAPDFASLTRQQFLTALADLRRRNDV